MGKVLVACEESQAVTKEMRALGWTPRDMRALGCTPSELIDIEAEFNSIEGEI